MTSFLVQYTNMKNENVTSEWIYDFHGLQSYMCTLFGKCFTAKVLKFNNNIQVGIMNVYANTENTEWVKM